MGGSNSPHLTMLLGFLILLSGCGRGPEGWTPVLEETSTVFLETETERISEHVQAALAQIHTDPGQAEASLEEAQVSLNHLRDYYLPLFQARERAYNAYRYVYLGDETRAAEELEKVQGTFERMAEALEGGALLELQALSETLADARIATLSDPERSGPLLESVARRLDLAVLKGRLIID